MNAKVIIPIYNESQSLRNLIAEIRRLNNSDFDFLFIDDASTDGSDKILTDCSMNFIRLPSQQGKGNALREGVLNSDSDFVIFMDGDGQDDPNSLFAIFEQLINNPGSAVIGSRFLKESIRYKNSVFLINHIGNLGVTWIINKLFNGQLTDSQASIKAFPAKIIKNLNLCKNDFLIETEIVVKLLQHKIPIIEIPVIRRERLSGYSKIHQVFGGRLRFTISFLKYVFQQRIGL